MAASGQQLEEADDEPLTNNIAKGWIDQKHLAIFINGNSAKYVIPLPLSIVDRCGVAFSCFIIISIFLFCELVCFAFYCFIIISIFSCELVLFLFCELVCLHMGAMGESLC